MAKTVASAIVGKLVPAVIRLLTRRVIGVNLDKVSHIMDNVAHGLDKLSPGEIVYDITKCVATTIIKKGGPLKYVDIVLVSGQVIRVVAKVICGETAGIGTAYIIERVADAIDRI